MQIVRGRFPQDGRQVEVTVEDGAVVAVRDSVHDDDVWLSAGFIDLQVNGYCGFDVNADDVDAETITLLTRMMFATGVTTFLPTVVTSSEEKITRALRAIAAARQRSQLVADAIPYVHVEGPYISAVDGPRGAHPAEHVRPPSLAEFARWQNTSGELVGMITLSPHFADSEEFISSVSSRGVRVALGHTDATEAQLRRAVNAGATLSTHLGNGIGAVLPRHPNLLWTQLAEDRLTATMIADGHHLPADTLKAMVRSKGIYRSILVSDVVATAGNPPGIYETPVGGRVALHSDGRLSLAGTSYLAGAALPLKDGVARAVGMGLSLKEAVQMATANPGRFVGRVGQLRIGARADLIRFTMDRSGDKLNIQSVLVGGQELIS